MNIFIVVSPLQMLNALEAKTHFKLSSKDCILIIFYPGFDKRNPVFDQRGYQQILSLVKPEEWHRVHSFYYKSRCLFPSIGIFSFIRELSWFRKLIKKVGKVEQVFFGEYFGDDNDSTLIKYFVATLKSDKIRLFDEGTASLIVLAGRKLHSTATVKRNKIIRYLMSYFRKFIILKLIFRMKSFRRELIDSYFTAYDIKPYGNAKIIKNNYNYYRSFLANKKKSNRVLFIGSSMRKYKYFNQGVSELELLRKVANLYKDKQVIYMPHRAEEKKDVDFLCNSLGWQYYFADRCLEHELLEMDSLPEEILGYFSSALINCSIMFKNIIKITVARFDDSTYCEGYHRNAVNDFLEYIKNDVELLKIN